MGTPHPRSLIFKPLDAFFCPREIKKGHAAVTLHLLVNMDEVLGCGERI